MKKRLIPGIILITILTICIFTYIIYNPEKAQIFGILVTIIFSGITVIVLFMTWNVYREILNVSKGTLSFTVRQTTFNSYFDNLKLFDDLSKRNISIVLKGEIDDELVPFFKNMTFITIHIHYINILENFPKIVTNGLKRERDINYVNVFKRFNYKIQSFINIIYDEIVKIKTNSNLTDANRTTLIDLYSFALSDYINLSKDLIQNIDFFKEGLPPIEITNFLKCNSQNRNVFNTEQFFKLYYEIEKKDYE